jgi:signal peptidase I
MEGNHLINYLIELKKPSRGLASIDLMEVFNLDSRGLKELDYKKNKAFRILSLDMYPNYSFNDVVTVSTNPKIICYDCRGGIQKGEIIVYQHPKKRNEISFGRVMAMPNDEIEIKNKEVFINGEKEELKSLINRSSKFNLSNFKYFKSSYKGISYIIAKDPKRNRNLYDLRTVVPKDSLFVLSDNRDYPLDSRSFGPIPFSKIIGVEIGVKNKTRIENTLIRLKPN